MLFSFWPLHEHRPEAWENHCRNGGYEYMYKLPIFPWFLGAARIPFRGTAKIPGPSYVLLGLRGAFHSGILDIPGVAGKSKVKLANCQGC